LKGEDAEGRRDKRGDVAWGGGDWIVSGICDIVPTILLSHHFRNRRFTPHPATSLALTLS
jgi:hypothetical protein